MGICSVGTFLWIGMYECTQYYVGFTCQNFILLNITQMGLFAWLYSLFITRLDIKIMFI